jgi:hypothetical protein
MSVNSPNSIEDAALEHIRTMSAASLRNLYQALLSGRLMVPLSADLTKDAAGRTDVPVQCIRLSNGDGCVPVFTSVDRLLEWKKEGTKYAEMPGPTLFVMVSGMLDIDCVIVNCSDVKGPPKGRISRPEFELLARGILPENK